MADKLEKPSQDELAGVPFWRGELYGKPVVLAITGVGKTYTAMTTTLFLQAFQPRAALMTGTGARINKTLRTGDVIVPRTLHFHDFGSLSSEGMTFRALKGPAGANRVENRFEPSETMLEIARLAIKDYPGQQVVLADQTYQGRVRLGVVATSDLFGVTAQRIKQLGEVFGTDIMEMESASFALVCQSLGVPYLVVRAGSNEAQETPNNDYQVMGPIAAEQAARFTYHLLRHL